MSFNYLWKNNEANFGHPLKEQVPGGTHISFEILLKKDAYYIALRRPEGIPNHELPSKAKNYPKGLLYFCHNLIRHGESVDQCVKRIVKEQVNVGIKKLRTVYIDSSFQTKDDQWAITPHIIVEVNQIPKINSQITEIVLFEKNKIPADFAWWSKEDLKEFLEEFD